METGRISRWTNSRWKLEGKVDGRRDRWKLERWMDEWRDENLKDR